MSNSLATVHPELIVEWSDRNLPLTPDSVTFGSNKKVWWKGACGHEWETSIKARSSGEKCPMQKLQEVLVKRLSENTVSDYLQTTNMDFLDMFLIAKHLEGCSDKTIRYYRCNIEKMLDTINIPVIKITTEMLRKYLVEYQTINNCGKVTIDNIRRSLSTFFRG